MWWRSITPWLNLHNSYHITGENFIHKIPPAPYSHSFHRTACFKTGNWKGVKVWREVVRANLASSLHSKEGHLYFKQHCSGLNRTADKSFQIQRKNLDFFGTIRWVASTEIKICLDIPINVQRTGLTVIEPKFSCFLTKFWCFNCFPRFQNENRSPKLCDFTMRELLFIL